MGINDTCICVSFSKNLWVRKRKIEILCHNPCTTGIDLFVFHLENYGINNRKTLHYYTASLNAVNPQYSIPPFTEDAILPFLFSFVDSMAIDIITVSFDLNHFFSTMKMAFTPRVRKFE